MPFFKRSGPSDRITSEDLANFGRWQFLKEQSGIDGSRALGFVAALNELVYTRDPADRAALVAELHRHAAKGEWEKVGAWKYVREWLDEGPDTQPLIDGGLFAVARMRVTNLGLNLAPVDSPRYQELTGGPVPDDGFVGPPVFDSSFGPSRQYYFDHAVATARSRVPARVPSRPGVEPGPIDDAARAMWDFGLLINRGPLLVSPDIQFEPDVVRPAVAAATGVDHGRFAELLVDKVLEPNSYPSAPWPSLGASRFIEEYLDPATGGNPAYDRALDEGLTLLLKNGMLNVSMPAEVLTPRAQQRLAQLR